MKKTLIFISLLISLCSNAQLKTQSNYDVDGDGNVNITDVSTTVQAALGKAVDDHQVVDAESLNTLLKSIDSRLANIEKNLGIADTHEYVDLGLSVKWATMNVGASSPEEYGNYYAWGETTTKSTYDWSTYKWCNGSITTLTKYNNSSSYGTVDNKTTLDLADDAAYVNWGENWRMPTHAEMQELYNNCTWTWTTQNGKNGYKVTSKKDTSKSIFLPAAGYRYGSSLDGDGSNGNFWSSSLGTGNPRNAWYLYFYSGSINPDDYYDGYRCNGHGVRPVRRQ